MKYVINEEFYTKHQTDSEVCDIDIGVPINCFIVADISAVLCMKCRVIGCMIGIRGYEDTKLY